MAKSDFLQGGVCVDVSNLFFAHIFSLQVFNFEVGLPEIYASEFSATWILCLRRSDNLVKSFVEKFQQPIFFTVTSTYIS